MRSGRNSPSEFEKVKGRIAAYRLASEKYNNAEKDHRAALKEQDDRRRMADRLADVERELPAAMEKAQAATKQAALASAEVERLQKERSESVERRRQTREKAQRISARLNVLAMQDRLQSAKKEAGRAAAIEAKVKELEQRLTDRLAPDQAVLDKLRANRRDAERIRAERDAASIRLTLHPDPGAAPPNRRHRRQTRGGRIRVRGATVGGSYHSRLGKGRRSPRIRLRRNGRLEQRLNLDAEFTDPRHGSASRPTKPDALERLAVRKVENEQTQLELTAKRKELKEAAPKGTAALQSAVVEIEIKLKNSAVEQWPKSSPFRTTGRNWNR